MPTPIPGRVVFIGSSITQGYEISGLAGWANQLGDLLIARNAATTLASAINASVTTIPLTSAALFPTSGEIWIGRESILYTGKSGNNLTGCVRPYRYSVAAAHAAGAAVTQGVKREFFNVALPSDTSWMQHARLARDVLNKRPSVIVLGPSPGVDGLKGAGKEAIIQALLNNTRKMVEMARASGAIPVICGCYPRGDWSVTAGAATGEWDYVRYCNDALARMGCAFIDWLGDLANPATGAWADASLAQADGIHPTAAGAAIMLRCVPPSYIDSPSPEPIGYESIVGRKGTCLITPDQGGAASGWIPVSVLPGDTDLPATSITVAMRLYCVSDYKNEVLCNISLSSDAFLRVSLPAASTVKVFNTAGALASLDSVVDPVTTKRWYHIALRYNARTGGVSLFIDGVSIGTVATITAGQTVSQVNFLGRQDTAAPAEGYAVCDLGIWRTALPDAQIAALAQGATWPGSCVFRSGFRDGQVWSNLRNEIIPSSWRAFVHAFVTSNYLSEVTVP